MYIKFLKILIVKTQSLLLIYSVFLNIYAVLINTIFWISVRLGKPGICSKYCFVPFFTVTSSSTTAGIDFGLRSHICSISISRSLYFAILPNYLADKLFSIGNTSSINKHELFSQYLMVISGLLASTFPSVCTAKCHRILE